MHDIYVKTEEYDNRVLFKVRGCLISQTTSDLEQIVFPYIQKCYNIDLDLTELDFLSSAGIRFFLKLLSEANEKNIKVKILKPNNVVLEVLKMTGITNFVKIEV